MATRSQPVECVIVGAGLAGLVAGSRLQQAGVGVSIIEKSAKAGGRLRALVMETDQGKAIFDAGAQFFTVREPQFESMVNDWLERELVTVWSHGFATADGSYYMDGHPRYRAVPDMAAIAIDLARDLDVRYQHRVKAISFSEGSWLISFEAKPPIKAQSLILSPPVPQSVKLLEAGEVSLQQTLEIKLARLRYTPCLAVLILLGGPGKIPEPGGLWPVGSPVDWIADNHRKGVSAVPGAITVHAGPEFSLAYWHKGDPRVVDRLLEHVSPWLGNPVHATHVVRWKYSKPDWLYPERCLVIDNPAPMIFAGDAFAGPRVEGAALSGLAAAEWFLSH